ASGGISGGASGGTSGGTEASGGISGGSKASIGAKSSTCAAGFQPWIPRFQTREVSLTSLFTNRRNRSSSLTGPLRWPAETYHQVLTPLHPRCTLRVSAWQFNLVYGEWEGPHVAARRSGDLRLTRKSQLVSLHSADHCRCSSQLALAE